MRLPKADREPAAEFETLLDEHTRETVEFVPVLLHVSEGTDVPGEIRVAQYVVPMFIRMDRSGRPKGISVKKEVTRT